MERNWLIRTKQNQILGPVAKDKVIEFYHKGALGLDDEICSGNGYWFSFKEKDLIDKYLLGDIPQGYNPISESRSHLSKRENPDRTSSLNAAPINAKEESFALEAEPVVLPDESDLDYPDITLVNKVIELPTAAKKDEEVKLPNQDDLEFPDITAISTMVNRSVSKETTPPVTLKSRPVEIKTENLSSEKEGPIVYPEDNDLAYPDLSIEDSPPQVSLDLREKSKEINLKKVKEVVHVAPAGVSTEEKKILHERKTKSSSRPLQKEGSAPSAKLPTERKVPEELKKRNDNYLMYILVIIVLVMIALFFYYYRTILNKPLPM